MKIALFVFTSLLFVCCALSLQAQQTVRGVVMDAQTRQPIEIATVQLFEGTHPIPLHYTLTQSDGTFSLSVGNQTDSLEVLVSLLGYKPVRQSVRPNSFVRFQLEQDVFKLKEVEIRPGRIWGQQDTIHYDVARFLTPKDESIQDILKKLPGIDVDERGKISYNGKNIRKFYVEGMDLTNGRYNQLSNNLQAKAVKSVQIVENHQAIRALQKKIQTEDIALNLTLKPEFRDRWMGSLKGGVGAFPLLWTGEGDAIQLSRTSQSAYLYKGNNTGQDVTDEQMIQTPVSFEKKNGPAVPTFLAQPTFNTPIKKERFLFNQTHTGSANRLYKLNETCQLRLNANYTHDLREQNRGSETRYYQSDDTVCLTEESQTRIRTDRATLSLELENNAEKRYLTNSFDLTGNWETGFSDFSGNPSMAQRIQTPDLGIRNYLHSLWSRDTYTLDARSLVRYHLLPARLYWEDRFQKTDLQQFYLDHSFSFLQKKGILTQQYTGGIIGDINTIRNSMRLYIKPNYQISIHKWRIHGSIPLTWTLFPEINFSRMTPNLSFLLQYKLNYAWRFTAFATYNENYGNSLDLYGKPYRTDYRNTVRPQGILPIYRQQNYSVYGEYKHTVREFFATFSVDHGQGWSNRIYEQRIENEQVSLIARLLSNRSYEWSLHGTLSKGFYDWGLKTALAYQLGRRKAALLSEGEIMPYRSYYMQYEPQISWSPFRRLEASYQATLRYGGSQIGESTRLQPLLNVVEKLLISFELTPVEIGFSVDHYHNDLNGTQAINAFFADLSFKWKTGKWQFRMDATNLFNKRQYRYTQYSSTQSYTSWVDIRPREFMAAVKYKF